MTDRTIRVTTTRHMELVDITAELSEAISRQGVDSGVLYLFNPHTTAGLTINEGADPDVQQDIILGLTDMVSANLPYRHLEGNSVSHIMALLTGSSLTVEIAGGRPVLGTWQKIFFCEYDGPRNRSVRWKIVGDNPTA
ncbi:secondary thiamine-phosphate synthase enzyme YjbQ [Desulforhopalus singaporensis]|uniref:Secondary thiamine-phosphate synthase enzyme n=1 Tax=Desulforhopalus singaporensis TaxID=91360 RepID=A0A1H0JRM5_9BACT|nr:secondary thiamine-phosphate synthase enzyme YjbQ [Desulforhopalus singaporensis]SDO46179.1 secondary thiamine-phosphate synthase enzyme [Desulforhopalus singaporensis]